MGPQRIHPMMMKEVFGVTVGMPSKGTGNNLLFTGKKFKKSKSHKFISISSTLSREEIKKIILKAVSKPRNTLLGTEMR